MLVRLAALAIAVTLLLTGAIAGFFYAYSVSAMPGLDLSAPVHAIPAMQGINVAVRNPVFFVSFFGTPVAALVAAGLCVLAGRWRAALFLAAAGGVYFAGAFLPTALVNVPMNRALAQVTAETAREAAEIWSAYSPRWTAWNTLRTVFSLASLMLVGLAIHAWAREAVRNAAARP